MPLHCSQELIACLMRTFRFLLRNKGQEKNVLGVPNVVCICCTNRGVKVSSAVDGSNLYLPLFSLNLSLGRGAMD